MWSRIKSLSIPISIKLTILYTAILFCILLFTSLLTVAGLYYVLYTQAEHDITISVNNITSYLAAGNPVNERLLKENFLEPDVILRVFDDQDNLLLDNAPSIPDNRQLLEKDKEGNHPLRIVLQNKEKLQVIHADHTYFYYISQVVQQGDHSFNLYFIKAMTEETHFLKTLIKILIATNLVGLLIAILSGIFISRKILRPIRDITEVAKEIEINDLGKRIQVGSSNDELRELARTFNHMLTRIQTGFEQQRRFAADASHELRTPITVISGYANMLDRWGKQDSSVLDEGISAIKSEAANMYGLIEKLLFLAKADQNKQFMNKTKLNVEHLIEEVVQETRLIAPNHHILLHQNDPALILADFSSIKQMLRIFIENSIKYTPRGGTIRIASCQTSNFLEITIQDTGIGIPKEDQTKIFERFYRVDKSRSKITGGTGLGLSIAYWIAEQHDTTIQLISTQGEGTTIILRTPLLPSKA
jgi:signal transduction histidine kinase